MGNLILTNYPSNSMSERAKVETGNVSDVSTGRRDGVIIAT